MDPYSKAQNGRNLLFVNEKGTSYGGVFSKGFTDQSPEARFFERIRTASMDVMKAYLQELTDERLSLYGLNRLDLN